MWKVLITDLEMRTKIDAKIREISVEISSHALHTDDIGLAGGKSGWILYYSYLNKYYQNNDFDHALESLIDSTVTSINKGVSINSFSNGISGFLWVLGHLKNHDFISLDDDDFEELIPILERAMNGYAAAKFFDYLNGSNGILQSLLEFGGKHRIDGPEKYLAWLIAAAEKDQSGIRWKSLLNLNEQELLVYNLGLAHGLSGIITFFCKLIQIYPEQKSLTGLIESAIAYLFACRKKSSQQGISLFPGYVCENGEASFPSRLAWCYGDLGVAVALKKAGETLGREDWIHEAITIMTHAAQRKNLPENHVYDAGFCHGAAGISHIFNRFYQSTSQEVFKDAATWWLQQALEMAIYPDGVAGFKKFEHELGWHRSSGLLDGVAGIGLVLMSSVSNHEPAWDQCLLLS